MEKTFLYCGEWFRPLRKMTKAEREQPLDALHGKLSRYSNEELESYWDLNEFYKVADSDADIYVWKGKFVIPSWDTFYILIGWL